MKPEIGLTFAQGLRHILRQDPNVIMVGEIRDFETAEIAIRAAMTGHLVFSTLHTNDAVGGITRLTDMGVEPFLLASVVRAFIAQRLVRTICPECKQARPVTRSSISRRSARWFPRASSITRAPGCENCRQTGYRGRAAIYEICVLTEGMRRLIISKATGGRPEAARDAGRHGNPAPGRLAARRPGPDDRRGSGPRDAERRGDRGAGADGLRLTLLEDINDMNRMNPKVDVYLSKAKKWQEEMEKLRMIILDGRLTEELKWGKPCYTFQNTNIVIIIGFKEYCALLFCKGALLKDAHGILIKAGENTQAARQIRFTNVREIVKMETDLESLYR